MNPISKATSVIFHPVQTASTVAGQTFGFAAAGVRTTMRILDRAAGRGHSDHVWSPATATTTPEGAAQPGGETASATAPPSRTSARKAARKTTPRKAPSARAATVAPALSEPERAVIDAEEVFTPSGIPAADEAHNPDTTDTDLHQPGTEPLMDPATVKAVKSEAEIMQRAADPDKG